MNQFVIENVVWSRPDDNASAGIDPLGRAFTAKRTASLSVPMAKDDTKLATTLSRGVSKSCLKQGSRPAARLHNVGASGF
jgi:hypothetical protein